jgi:hypothetical protein
MHIARYAVCLRNGRVHTKGSTDSIILDELDLSSVEEPAPDQRTPKLPGDKSEPEAAQEASGQLVVAEEKNEGRVSLASFGLFLDSISGRWPVLFWAAYIFGNVGIVATLTIEPW